MTNPLQSLYVYYRLLRRRLFRWHLRRFLRRLQRRTRIERRPGANIEPHPTTRKLSEDYMRSLKS